MIGRHLRAHGHGALNQGDGLLGSPLLVVDHPQQAARVGIARIASQGRRVEPRRPGQVARVMEP